MRKHTMKIYHINWKTNSCTREESTFHGSDMRDWKDNKKMEKILLCDKKICKTQRQNQN